MSLCDGESSVPISRRITATDLQLKMRRDLIMPESTRPPSGHAAQTDGHDEQSTP